MKVSRNVFFAVARRSCVSVSGDLYDLVFPCLRRVLVLAFPRDAQDLDAFAAVAA